MPYNSVIGRTDVASMIPTEYSMELLQSMQTQTSAVMQLGRRLRDMTAYEEKLPVLSALATAYFVSKDTGLVQTTEVNWEDVTIYAEDLAVIVPVPKNVLNDSRVPIWDQVRPELQSALGLAIDNAVLYGTNKPSTWPTALITAAAAASHGVAIGAGADLYEDILEEDGVFAQIETDGYAVTGVVMHLSMKGKLRGVRDANGNPIFNRNPAMASGYDLDGAQAIFPMNGSASSSYPLVAGDWRQLAYSVREGMSFEVFTEGVIQDNSGNTVYNLMQQRMAAIMITMQLGFALANPPNRINETAATRYPFSYLSA
jgi:HK97 family phage major capsid protein